METVRALVRWPRIRKGWRDKVGNFFADDRLAAKPQPMIGSSRVGSCPLFCWVYLMGISGARPQSNLAGRREVTGRGLCRC